MNKQSVTTAIEIKNGVVVRSGKGSIYQPATHFKGGSVKWYEDRKRVDDKEGADKEFRRLISDIWEELRDWDPDEILKLGEDAIQKLEILNVQTPTIAFCRKLFDIMYSIREEQIHLHEKGVQ